MDTFSHVPPGFRFHPTDEELVDYHLRKKVASRKIDLDVIKDVDLYKIEPWDLQEKCKISAEEQNDWYFFSHKDKKYPTGTRTNRATTAGFWKATGRDKPIYSKNNLVGMRKTLVFYKGRAPNGQKSDWIMHEYRLETNENAAPQEEGWVVCRVFKKRVTAIRRPSDHESSCWYDENSPVSFMPPDLYSCKPEIEMHHYNNMISHPHDPMFLQLPNLESPKLPSAYIVSQGQQSSPVAALDHQEPIQIISVYNNSAEHVTDWRVLDKFVASQLSHDDIDIVASKAANYSPNSANVELIQVSDKQEALDDYASTSNSSATRIDLWK